jgi:hypothetical protein
MMCADMLEPLSIRSMRYVLMCVTRTVRYKLDQYYGLKDVKRRIS